MLLFIKESPISIFQPKKTTSLKTLAGRRQLNLNLCVYRTCFGVDEVGVLAFKTAFLCQVVDTTELPSQIVYVKPSPLLMAMTLVVQYSQRTLRCRDGAMWIPCLTNTKSSQWIPMESTHTHGYQWTSTDICGLIPWGMHGFF